MTAKAPIAGVTAAVLLLIAASVQPAQAYSLEGPRWANAGTNFYYAVSGQPSWAFSTALRQALVDWNQVSAFHWTGFQKVANPCANSGPNGAALKPTACGQSFGSGVLGITMFSFTSNNRMIHAGTVFNSHV